MSTNKIYPVLRNYLELNLRLLPEFQKRGNRRLSKKTLLNTRDNMK